MPANKNALLRYRTIDHCLRNPYRIWTIEDLAEAVGNALRENEGIEKGVSIRTLQNDLQMMRSDKLGYNAPIEVYDKKYYRYTDVSYSIDHPNMGAEDLELISETLALLRTYRGNTEIETALIRVARLLRRVISA